ncbi:ABC transporter substrate-binding protein [Cumulibacter soli]|uniref:ABC transporter substrate-binding protein n=1 Tax=Cumulibacter soli TaxID=2546344 RepID=UPI0010689CA7|nr:ABC transporter substrate-binding protein [Cumulibacter soli]
MNKKLIAGVGFGLAASMALSACSTKAGDGGGGEGADGLKTDYGVTDDTITLGALTDSSGPFKVGGVLVTHGNQIWVDEVNEAGGICGRQIELNVIDTGYKADTAVSMYDANKEESVGLIQIIGSAVFAALKQKMISDQIMGSSPTIASVNLDSEIMLSVGTTFDVEAINGMAYMQSEGKIADGDKVGAIYLDNEAGQNSFAGVEAYAEQHDIEVAGAPIAPTDTDMTTTVTKFKSQGVDLVYVAVPPAALTSTALAMQSQGLDVPLLGFNSSFQPSVIADPSVLPALDEFYLQTPNVVWSSDAAAPLREAYEASGSEDAPSQSIITGYLSGVAWGAVLEQACEDGDMTRQGLMDARKKITALDTKGLTGELDFSDPGAPVTRVTAIAQVDTDAPGSLVEVLAPTASSEAEDYKTPYQK